MDNRLYVAEAKERPLIVKDQKVYAKSRDERLMVEIHKNNIKAQNISEHGSNVWKPQHKLTFTF